MRKFAAFVDRNIVGRAKINSNSFDVRENFSCFQVALHSSIKLLKFMTSFTFHPSVCKIFHSSFTLFKQCWFLPEKGKVFLNYIILLEAWTWTVMQFLFCW